MKLTRTKEIVVYAFSVLLFSGCASLRQRAIYKDPHDIRLTSIHATLPPGAFRASIEPAYSLPGNLKVSQRVALHFVVTNRSDVSWPSGATNDGKYQLSIGNHWRDQAGKLITMDDGRSSLPYDVDPNASAEILLTVNAPNKPGTYILEVEPVQEQVAWFSQNGSKSFQTSVTVEEN